MSEIYNAKYMKKAIELAKRGEGWVSPNPLVGAVIVKNGKIIGEGWHVKYGELHAERHALANCTEDPCGADMYVTLEPCCHYGKQPPCTEAIVEAGIRRVFIGSDDPNPLVAGKGITYLKDHEVAVVTGIEKELCDSINAVFFHFITTGTPYVTMKYAMTMDGKIAAGSGESRWITGESSRKRVHKDRHCNRGIMAGVNTVIADDPLLTCRIEGGRNPVRIICDTNLRTPLDSNIVKTALDVETVIATAVEDKNMILPYEAAGCCILHPKVLDGHIDLKNLMKLLGEMKIDSILLEGGGTLNWSALEAEIVQKVQTYIGPMILGGETAKTPVSGAGAFHMSEKIMLKPVITERIDEDFYIESEVIRCSQD